jgi:hypothetical protein
VKLWIGEESRTEVRIGYGCCCRRVPLFGQAAGIVLSRRFDWAGLRIIDQLLREFAAIPWRMGVEAYASVEGAFPIDPQPLNTNWAPDLAATLRTRGIAVFEEQVVRSLLHDLSRCR